MRTRSSKTRLRSFGCVRLYPCQARAHTPNLWLEDGERKHRILIVWDEPMPGVGRPWFECPACGCGRRSRHLYLRDRPACRLCHELKYTSHHLQQTPGVARVARLRGKLSDCETRPFAPLPARILHGRSRARHEGLVAAIRAEEAKLVEQLGGIAHDLERRIRSRKAKGKW